MAPTDDTTHFGFETVREDEKAGRVQGVIFRSGFWNARAQVTRRC